MSALLRLLLRACRLWLRARSRRRATVPHVPIPRAHQMAADRFRGLFNAVPLTDAERLLGPSPEDVGIVDEPHRPTEAEWIDLGRPPDAADVCTPPTSAAGHRDQGRWAREQVVVEVVERTCRSVYLLDAGRVSFIDNQRAVDRPH